MRTTINLDEELVQKAQRVTGTRDRTALIHDGLRALIAKESARRLAKLGGSEPQAAAPRRRVAARSAFPVFEVSPDAPPLTLEMVTEALDED
jgi:Arc/MetJ family transcription regulator